MCGIYGVYNKEIKKELAWKCLERLQHRGPDAGRIWQENGMTFGHRRLAILDLSDSGIQPMADISERYEIVFNGEIYNFIEIREELEKKGYLFRTDTDTEVLLYSFIEWKEKCLEKFNGMWAFLIYDRETRRCFISRDRFGVKPFYYTVLGGSPDYSFAFASEMKALLPMLKNVRPNRKIVCNVSGLVHYENTEECVYEDIKRFPAGCYAYADSSGMKIERYWNTLDHLQEMPESYDEQVEIFRELFLDAVKLRMRSDVQLGTALSGGLDSSATICAMAHIADGEASERVNRDWQHAYVASFPGTTMDEKIYAEKVTDYLNIESTYVDIDPAGISDKMDEMFWLFEDIYITSPIPMMMLYHSLRENNTLVTIDGHGADELFGGYTFDFIHAFDDAHNAEERKIVADTYINSFPRDGSNISLKNTNTKKLFFDYQRHKFTRKIRERNVQANILHDKKFYELDSLNRILYDSVHENILPTLLRNYDRYSMASGVEIRMPFMDYRIVQFAFSIGWRSKLHGGYSKSIIRDAMAPYMPEEIAYRRTKIGFNTPIVEWMQGPLREYFLDTVNSENFRSCDIINPGRVRKMVTDVISDPKASFISGEEAWSALNPYLWLKAVEKYNV